MNESEAFDKYHDGLKLNPMERLRAERCHAEITQLLISAGLVLSAFLQGSFARKTMISPLRDIDKVVVLDPSLAGLTPDQVMNRLQSVLETHYPGAKFDRTRHSLKLEFGDDTFCFDVVPAWETDTDDDDVLIANRDTGGWDRSNTRELMRVVAERNERCNGRFIHVVRMIKHLVAHKMDEVIPGLHVESIAYLAVTAPMGYPDACLAVLEMGALVLASEYTDPTGRDRISDRLTAAERRRAQQFFSTAAATAREAHDLALEGDDSAANAVWYDIFGDPYPKPKSSNMSVAAALAASAGGSITSRGDVSPTRAGRQPAPPSRSWRSR